MNSELLQTKSKLCSLRNQVERSPVILKIVIFVFLIVFSFFLISKIIISKDEVIKRMINGKNAEYCLVADEQLILKIKSNYSENNYFNFKKEKCSGNREMYIYPKIDGTKFKGTKDTAFNIRTSFKCRIVLGVFLFMVSIFLNIALFLSDNFTDILAILQMRYRCFKPFYLLSKDKDQLNTKDTENIKLFIQEYPEFKEKYKLSSKKIGDFELAYLITNAIEYLNTVEKNCALNLAKKRKKDLFTLVEKELKKTHHDDKKNKLKESLKALSKDKDQAISDLTTRYKKAVENKRRKKVETTKALIINALINEAETRIIRLTSFTQSRNNDTKHDNTKKAILKMILDLTDEINDLFIKIDEILDNKT